MLGKRWKSTALSLNIDIEDRVVRDVQKYNAHLHTFLLSRLLAPKIAITAGMNASTQVRGQINLCCRQRSPQIW